VTLGKSVFILTEVRLQDGDPYLEFSLCEGEDTSWRTFKTVTIDLRDVNLRDHKPLAEFEWVGTKIFVYLAYA